MGPSAGELREIFLMVDVGFTGSGSSSECLVHLLLKEGSHVTLAGWAAKINQHESEGDLR